MKIYKTPNLWNSAKKLIPGGNGLLSKRPDRYLPSKWSCICYPKKLSNK